MASTPAPTPANPSSAQSNPAPGGGGNPPSSGGNLPSGTQTNPPSNSNPSNSASGSDDVIISERFLADSAWPKDLILDLGKVQLVGLELPSRKSHGQSRLLQMARWKPPPPRSNVPPQSPLDLAFERPIPPCLHACPHF